MSSAELTPEAPQPRGGQEPSRAPPPPQPPPTPPQRRRAAPVSFICEKLESGG